MIEKLNLEIFGQKVADEWKALNKTEILNGILTSFNATRVDRTSDKCFPNQFGIYAFYIKPKKDYIDISSLEKDWNLESFKKFPKIVKKRFGKYNSDDGWFPFYIGKSEKLWSRIKENLTHDSQHATYGLKLRERTEFLEINKIEVGF
jgi:hypothetical protein